MNFQIDNNISNYDCEVKFNFNAEVNNDLLIQNNDKFIYYINLKDEKLKDNKIRPTINSITKNLNKAKIKSAIITCEGEKFINIATIEFIASNYKIQKAHKTDAEENSLNLIAFNTNKNYKNIINNAIEVGLGINFSKDLADKPSNICTPEYLAQKAQELAKEYKLKCEILKDKDMEKLGMNSLLSVAKGSINSPRLITLKYQNDDNAKPIVLVGKGVTFDSGGISLKPGAAMDEMKYDMAGGAAVLGVIKAIAAIQSKINLIVIIPAVENMPDSNASKPGDVIKSMSGQTIEILNTDAEGRLILCDALTYAEKFKPQAVIDVATLTGAVIIALGKKHSGVMGNNDDLIQDLILSGKEIEDTLWQLPLDEEFDEQLSSNFADMANIGGREAGSITAGCFLARFATKFNWAHLDIAGTAWLGGKQKGATGRPVSMLCDYIIKKSK